MTEAREVPVVTRAGGVAMPMVGFGAWQMRAHSACEAVLRALRAGYRHVDTATMYANEAEVGHALRDSGLPRQEVFLTTKLRASDAGREEKVLSSSLRALGTDYVDLWLVHWPPRGKASVSVWREFLALRDEGLARAVGVSNYSLRQIDELIEATGEAPAVHPTRRSRRRYEAGPLTRMRPRGIVVEGYSPLKDSNLRDPVLADIAAA